MTHLLIIKWSVQNILPCEHMDHGNMGCFMSVIILTLSIIGKKKGHIRAKSKVYIN